MVETCEWCDYWPAVPGGTAHAMECPKADYSIFASPSYVSTDTGLYECSKCFSVVLLRSHSSHSSWHQRQWFAFKRQHQENKRIEGLYFAPNVHLAL